LYREGPLIAEQDLGQASAWLPEGRSVFRDKRIPRENLNGLLVGRSGLSAALYGLTGIGGPWAQDPPHYAQVLDFETGPEWDGSHTRIEGWRGWQHDRQVYFYHKAGPIIVLDRADGPGAGRAAIAWHLDGDGEVRERRISIRGGDEPVEVVFVPIANEGQLSVSKRGDGDIYHPAVSWSVSSGRLQLATVFLFDRWVGAQVKIDQEGQALQIMQGAEAISLPLWDEE
jgi:hypothetical protein